jgi:MoxR-like ATPase
VTFASPDELQAALRAESYLADHSLAVSLYLALAMQRPLLLEGEPESARPRSRGRSHGCAASS